jgi:[ribosomal protein S5]-alanine N-acetyltransferase
LIVRSPIIETERLTLSQYEPGDEALLYPIVSDPVTMSHYPQPFTLEQAKAWIDRSLKLYSEDGFGRYGVRLRNSGRYIGDVGFFRAEVNGIPEIDLGYIIDKQYWGKGYATEAAAACVARAFQNRWFTRIAVQMAHSNTASRKVAERLGAQLEADFINPRNRNYPTHLFVIELP